MLLEQSQKAIGFVVTVESLCHFDLLLTADSVGCRQIREMIWPKRRAKAFRGVDVMDDLTSDGRQKVDMGRSLHGDAGPAMQLAGELTRGALCLRNLLQYGVRSMEHAHEAFLSRTREAKQLGKIQREISG